MIDDLSLDEIVELLDRHRQRATYGVVADYLGRPPAFLMSGIERAPRYSWVVNRKTLCPTGYAGAETHGDLERKSANSNRTPSLAAQTHFCLECRLTYRWN
jgi:hypothetical protein